MKTTTRTHTNGPAVAYHAYELLDLLKGAMAAIWKRMKHRRVLRQLLTKSDYELLDIGVTRNDVHRELMKPFWQR